MVLMMRNMLRITEFIRMIRLMHCVANAVTLDDESDDNQTDAVSNLMLGLFSGEETAKLFYTADLDVLLDVILRRLVDYGPGDKVFKAFF